jgi:8-oxo-dGTP pyrophosphatase MutT (NUDIX family)
MKRRCVVALIEGPGNTLLMGKRNDSGKYSLPAGHCEEGEDPHTALIREVKEETGLDVKDSKLVRAGVNEDSVAVFLYTVKVDPEQKIDPSEDPDEEFDRLTYEDPLERASEMHIPPHKNWGFKYWAECM